MDRLPDACCVAAIIAHRLPRSTKSPLLVMSIRLPLRHKVTLHVTCEPGADEALRHDSGKLSADAQKSAPENVT
jgi:hypothetical protein